MQTFSTAPLALASHIVTNFKVRFFRNFQNILLCFAAPCSNVGTNIQLWERNWHSGFALPFWRCIWFLVNFINCANWHGLLLCMQLLQKSSAVHRHQHFYNHRSLCVCQLHVLCRPWHWRSPTVRGSRCGSLYHFLMHAYNYLYVCM